MGTYSSVACAEVPGTAQEVGDIQQGKSASVRLMCDWADRAALISDLLDTPRPWPKATGLVPYAVRASASWIGVEAYTTSGQECTPEFAYVDVSYNTTIIDVASETIEPNMEAIPLDYRYFNWGSPTQKLVEGEAPPFIFRSLNLTRTRYRLSVISNDVIDLVGHVNNASYVSPLLGLTFPAETLLYMPGSVNRSLSNFTTSGFTVTERFSYKPQGWNKYWRASTQSWETIYLAGAGGAYTAYPPADFAANLLD